MKEEAKPAKKPLTAEERIAKLEQLVRDQAYQILQMQRVGGFADSRMIGIRCANIEKRLDLVELDGEMLKDTTAMAVAGMESHLKDRHDANFARFDGNDVGAVARIRRRLADWAEKRGLMTKRKDVGDVRRDEGRVKPRIHGDVVSA